MRAKVINESNFWDSLQKNNRNENEFMGDFHLELTKLLNQAMLKLPGDVIKDLVDQALDELGIDDDYESPDPGVIWVKDNVKEN